MDGTTNRKRNREYTEDSPTTDKRQAAKRRRTAYSENNFDSSIELEYNSNMLPFNILAKCAAKELKQLTRNSLDKENIGEDHINTSQDESDYQDMEFPCVGRGRAKAYRCIFHGCEKEFPSLSRMRRHYIIHTGVKPFKCINKECTKSFSRRDNMIQHYKAHCIYSTSEPKD